MINRLVRSARYGIVLGCIFGCVGGMREVLPQRYLDYHLYNTAFRAIAVRVDSNLGLMIAVSLAMSIIWWSSWSLQPALRTACRWASALLALVFLSWTSGVIGTLKEPEVHGKLIEFMDQTKWQLLGALACVVLGLNVLKRVGSSLPQKNVGKSMAVSDVTLPTRLLAFIGRRNHLTVFALIVALGINLAALYFHIMAAVSVSSKPNILFVMFDTCRADQLGCYGYHLDTSPNVDQFAEDAMRFDRAISQASITTASVGSFMTSRYPQSIILKDAGNFLGVPKHLPTLAEVLKDRGYNTSAIVSNIFAQSRLGFSQGFDYFNEELKFTDVTSPGVLSLALKRLKEVKNKPFFMYLLFMDPHTPYIKHDEYDYPGYKGSLGTRVEIQDQEAAEAARRFSAEDVRYMRALYDGEIKFTDAHFGLLLAELKKANLYDDTLIVFLGDHGEEFMEHGLLLHGHAVYDESIHVPLIIKLPGQKKGSIVRGVFPLIDLFPSIIKYIGNDPSATRPHGTAVSLDNLTSSQSDKVFTAEDTRFGKLWAVQNDKYKLIWNTTTHSRELFDMTKDRLEKTNIAEEKSAVLNSLLEAAKGKEEIVGWKAGNEGKTGLSPQVFTDPERERLRSLGYAQ